MSYFIGKNREFLILYYAQGSSIGERINTQNILKFGVLFEIGANMTQFKF